MIRHLTTLLQRCLRCFLSRAEPHPLLSHIALGVSRRLAPVRLPVRRIVLLGECAERIVGALRQRYPKAKFVQEGERSDLCVIYQQSFNLEAFAALLSRAHDSLREGGICVVVSFGPDTALDLYMGENPFMDMHDVGDALLRESFATPVLDCERLVFRYRRRTSLRDDLLRLFPQLVTSADTLDAAGVLEMPIELIFAHAFTVRKLSVMDEAGCVNIPVTALRSSQASVPRQ